jgi:ABC-type glycerol-3-phosphate transport system substrate-binding protein
MEGSSFFLVPEEKRSGLDYRWYAEGGIVPLSEGVVFAAIPRAGRDKAAAEAFLKWFYREDSQKLMLEEARKSRSIEGSFGIAGGFSAVRPVTEKVFPLYYPSLVGHLPPAEGLAGPEALPSDWEGIKAKVLEPWILEATATPASSSPTGAAAQGGAQAPAQKPGELLSARLAGWYKNR